MPLTASFDYPTVDICWQYHCPLPWDHKNFTGSCLSDILLSDQLSNNAICASSQDKPTHYQCLTNYSFRGEMHHSSPLLCNGKIPLCIDTSWQDYVPCCVIPQVYLYREIEGLLLLQTRQRQEIFLHLLVGIGLAISLGSAGTTMAAILQRRDLARDFETSSIRPWHPWLTALNSSSYR